ncbi:unnamed protein product, partial [Staurois parvus]
MISPRLVIAYKPADSVVTSWNTDSKRKIFGRLEKFRSICLSVISVSPLGIFSITT